MDDLAVKILLLFLGGIVTLLIGSIYALVNMWGKQKEQQKDISRLQEDVKEQRSQLSVIGQQVRDDFKSIDSKLDDLLGQ